MAGIFWHVPDSTPAGIGGIDEYTVLMMHMDGDQSDSQHVVTHNGDPQFSTAQSKFGGSSMNFDGTGDYLSIPDHAEWYFGSNDFTIDCWVRFDSLNEASPQMIMGQHSGNYLYLYIEAFNHVRGDGNKLKFIYGTSPGSTEILTTNISFSSINTWYHVAFVRNGSVPYIFIDGVEMSLTTFGPLQTMLNIPAPLEIGEHIIGSGMYIDEFRISNTARWTTGFTPDTSPYTSDANTKLLLHFDGDVSDSAHVVTSNGNPQLNATTTKFDGAVYFDGTGDYLSVADSDDFSFGVDSYTIDFWIRWNGSVSNDSIMGQSQGGGDTQKWAIVYGAVSAGNMTLAINFNPGSAYNRHFAWAPSADTWYHLAFVQDGPTDTLYFFVDGIGTGSTYNHYQGMPNVASTLNIGADGELWKYLNGYIDELRISKGIARWTSNFTPETGPYTI